MIRSAFQLLLVGTLLAVALGCRGGLSAHRQPITAVKAGYNTNNLVDPIAQSDEDDLADMKDLYRLAESLKKKPTPEQIALRRSVLCLSGGGSYGAYSAGVLCGWTASGDRPGCNGRPNFSVVTGISTGALIAPFAFLGPQYDEEVRKFYTTIEKRDIFRMKPVRGLFTIALADNTPLAELVDRTITPQIIQEIAAEHRAGRRLYIGTTELEGRRFVFWDIGEIAGRGCAGDRDLIKKILLGSSAIPGFFPPSVIPITVDGKQYVEKHGDGGTSVAIFFRPPYTPPEQRTTTANDLAGVDLYMIVAGKLYADPSPMKPRSLSIAASSVSTVIYAQTRGDLQRMYLASVLGGMNYHLAAIPPEYPAPASSTDFRSEPMTRMFNEGYREAATGTLWRSTPPGIEYGESPLKRQGTDLVTQPRSPSSTAPSGTTPPLLAPGSFPIPVVPKGFDK